MIHSVRRLSLWTAAVIMIIAFSCCSARNASKSTNAKAKGSEIQKLLNEHDFKFVAESVNPLRGRQRIVTSEYDVTLSNDSLISYLPYFGRARTAPLNATKSVLDFISDDFNYTITPVKDNRWDIAIRLKDAPEIQQFNFTVFNNGSASLQVTCTNRDPISFNGYITGR